MRIIAGERRGAKLEAVPGMNTRPTADRVKEGLFNIIQMEIASDTRVLDVFAGTALSALRRSAAAQRRSVSSSKRRRRSPCSSATSPNVATKIVRMCSRATR